MRTNEIHIFVVALLVACSREQDAPPADDTTAGGVDTSGNPSTTLESTVGDPTGDVSSGGSEGSTGPSETGTTGEECLGPDGCWACEPDSNAQLLNRCTDAVCEPFENTPERLPLLGRDGSLPPIP